MEARFPGGVKLSYKVSGPEGAGRACSGCGAPPRSHIGTQVLIAPASSSAGCRHNPPPPGPKGAAL